MGKNTTDSEEPATTILFHSDEGNLPLAGARQSAVADDSAAADARQPLLPKLAVEDYLRRRRGKGSASGSLHNTIENRITANDSLS